MSGKRIHTVAKELRIKSPELIDYLKELGYVYTSHLNNLEDNIVKEVIELYKSKSIQEAEIILEKENVKEVEIKPKAENKETFIYLPGKIGVKELAELIKITRMDLVKKLMELGITNVSEKIDYDTAEMICDEYGIATKLRIQNKKVVTHSAEKLKGMLERPPIVTVMGHVDHGKTSLLDAIKKTRVADGEAGGITQHIGAYQVENDGKLITFLDTPGHEAFTAMRAHGANLTDIVVLVVAADDGVQPQTIEAIDHSINAEVPIIVAINKIDRDNANVDRVKEQLSNHGLISETWGGDTIFVEISAKNEENIDSVLEMITLQAEMLELMANPNSKPSGVVIESYLDKGRGPVATILIREGSLKKGDCITIGSTYGKVRNISNDKGITIKKALPAQPVEIFGLSDIPIVGQDMLWAKNEKKARSAAEDFKLKIKIEEHQHVPLSLKELFAQMKEMETQELNIILKADVQGSIQALKGALEKLSNETITVKVIRHGVGAVTESDIMLASASNAIIIGFCVRSTGSAKKIAEKEKVELNFFDVIYDAIDSVTAAIKGLEEPELREVIVGFAEIRQTFKVPKMGVIAGCKVQQGQIIRNCSARLIRNGEVMHTGKISSLRRFKEDVKEVDNGYECGIGIENCQDLREGDLIEAFEMKEDV
ncbi:translation initiation factor IF-2 [bacterium]|nr:translation initiation factor IF-2 [bacterium]